MANETDIATSIMGETVRLAFSGSVAVLKVSGKAAAHGIALLAAVLKSNNHSFGKTRLKELLQEGKGITLFTIKESDRNDFAKAAKKYGLKYSLVRDTKANTGQVDIFVRATDAAVVNRIIEIYKMSVVKQDINIETEKYEEAKPYEYGDVTISKKTNSLVVEERENQIKTRVPGTYGKEVRYLFLDKEELTEVNDGKSYLFHLDPEKEYTLYDKSDEEIKIKGDELLTHYDDKSRSKVKNSKALTENESQSGKESTEKSSDYKKPSETRDSVRNKFHNFTQRTYDFEKLEKELLSKRHTVVTEKDTPFEHEDK